MSTPGPQHDRWADSVGSYLLGALPPDERDGFAAHLDECPVCRQDVDELAVAAEALPLSVPAVAPPPALKQRIMAEVESEAELLAAAGEEDAAPASARPRRSGFLAGLFSRPAVALACAAVLLVAGGVAGAVLSGGEDSRTIDGRTTLADASVELEVSDDAATLVARSVPPPPPGELYQVWIKRPGVEAPEPTDVLWSPRNGAADVAVPGAVDDAEAVLVTREPRRGSETPSEDPVITIPLA